MVLTCVCVFSNVIGEGLKALEDCGRGKVVSLRQLSLSKFENLGEDRAALLAFLAEHRRGERIGQKVGKLAVAAVGEVRMLRVYVGVLQRAFSLLGVSSAASTRLEELLALRDEASRQRVLVSGCDVLWACGSALLMRVHRVLLWRQAAWRGGRRRRLWCLGRRWVVRLG